MPTNNRHHRALIFEVTTACNHDCLHCYNVWKNPPAYPTRQMTTGETIACLEKVIAETGLSLLTLSGGEPLLRDDLFEIIDFLHGRGITLNLLTNGTLLTEAALARLLPDKISLFEIPLLSAEAGIHDRLSGAMEAFDGATRAIADLKSADQSVVVSFVATRLNLPGFRGVFELAVALGVDGLMFNRFNPGGEGFKNIELLQASPDELAEALTVADHLCGIYGLSVSCSIAMPPCLFDTARYEHIGFGLCAAGTADAYYTIDPAGNLRPCNHSPTILGNVRHESFYDLIDGATARDFFAARPVFCRGCALETTCRGGCKAAAEACFGSPHALDPFLLAYKDRAVKPIA